MSFYINSNLSPLEAVKQHKFLQVNPVIEEWARAAEELDWLLRELENVCDNDKLRTAKQIRDEIRDNILSNYARAE